MLGNGFWVFGYGSLVWQPGFEYAERKIARLDGYARSFCMRSIHHRGTVDDPGLVLALDAAQSSCDGVAFFVSPEHSEQTISDLRERELISSAYLEKILPVSLRDGRQVEAVSYVIDPDHNQYCSLSLEQQAQIIAVAHGGRGPNVEYLLNTASHLAELGLEDPDLTWLSDRVRDIRRDLGLD
jgi:cation transport protein ChaC